MKSFIKLVVILLLALSAKTFGQISTVFHLNKLPQQDTLLSGWKIYAGDDPQFAAPNFNDSNWQPVDPGQDVTQLKELKSSTVCWIRLHIKADSSISNQQLVAWVFQYVASEIYLDGKLVKKYGTISSNAAQTTAFYPSGDLFDLKLKPNTEQVIAVRLGYQSGLPYCSPYFTPLSAFSMYVNDYNTAYVNSQQNNYFTTKVLILAGAFSGMLFIISLIYLFYFLFERTRKVHLYYSIACALSFLLNLCFTFFVNNIELVSVQMWMAYLIPVGFVSSSLFMLLTIYTLFGYTKRNVFKLLLAIGVAVLVLTLFSDITGFVIATNVYLTISTLEGIRVSIWAMKFKKKGAAIILSGLISIIILNGWSALLPQADFFSIILAFLSILGFPLGMSIYLAVQNAITNQTLRSSLTEVQKLSAENILKEQEKQQILSNQNELLEQQVSERTAALEQSLNDLQSTQKQLIQSEKMASLGELTAGIAHEIQNPLNFVNNFSEVNKELLVEMKDEMDKGNMDDAKAIANDVIDNEEKINHHGKRAGDIVKGMLQHSRSSSGIKEPTDINALADEYLRLSYHGLRAKDKSFNAEMKTDFDESIGNINIVPQDIGRVILNLITNAFYVVDEKKNQGLKGYEPTVTIKTLKNPPSGGRGAEVLICVKDNGNGIPQKVLDKIFQPFFTTKPTGSGTGLGLSLSYDIIKAHGGEIKVNTSEGEGSEFIIQLPNI